MEIEKVFPFLPKKGEFFVTSLKQSQSHFSWHCGASSFFLSSISSSLEKAFFVKSTLKLASTFSCHPITTWTLEASLENPSSVNRGLLLAWRPLVGSDASSLGVERERRETLLFFPMAKQCWWYSNDTVHDLLSGKPESAENPFWNPLLTWFLLQKFVQSKSTAEQFKRDQFLSFEDFFSSHFQANQATTQVHLNFRRDNWQLDVGSSHLSITSLLQLEL